MCTRLLRKFLMTETFKKWHVINLAKICFFNKSILNIARNKGYNKVPTFYTKLQIPKHNQNYENTLRIYLLTSMWYETNKEDVAENLAHLINLAKIALERGDYERAQEILHLGLQISEQHNIYEAVPNLYDILAKIALGLGDIKRAQDLCITAIEKLTIWGFPENDYNVIDFKLKVAKICSVNGQNDLAKVGFDTCLKLQEEKILNGDTTDKTGVLYITILFWYGVHMIKQDNFVSAKTMINTAYDFSSKLKGLSVKQEMIILFMLSNVNIELGDYENALTSMLNAIVLGKSISSVDLPLCYMKLGHIYEQTGNLVEAKFAFEEALKSAKTFGFFDIVMDAEDALAELKEQSNNNEVKN